MTPMYESVDVPDRLVYKSERLRLNNLKIKQKLTWLDRYQACEQLYRPDEHDQWR